MLTNLDRLEAAARQLYESVRDLIGMTADWEQLPHVDVNTFRAMARRVFDAAGITFARHAPCESSQEELILLSDFDGAMTPPRG